MKIEIYNTHIRNTHTKAAREQSLGASNHGEDEGREAR